MDMYTGQYSLLLVATETVVLSLLRMIGMTMAPWVSVSSAIIVCKAITMNSLTITRGN